MISSHYYNPKELSWTVFISFFSILRYSQLAVCRNPNSKFLCSESMRERCFRQAQASADGSRKVTLHSRLQKITKIYMSTNFSLELLANDDFGFPSSLRSVTIN